MDSHKVGFFETCHFKFVHLVGVLTLSLPSLAKSKFRPNFQILFCEILKKQIAPCESTGRKDSFEWSHHRILSAVSKVRVTLQNSIKHSGSGRVKRSKCAVCIFNRD